MASPFQSPLPSFSAAVLLLPDGHLPASSFSPRTPSRRASLSSGAGTDGRVPSASSRDEPPPRQARAITSGSKTAPPSSLRFITRTEDLNDSSPCRPSIGLCGSGTSDVTRTRRTFWSSWFVPFASVHLGVRRLLSRRLCRPLVSLGLSLQDRNYTPGTPRISVSSG